MDYAMARLEVRWRKPGVCGKRLIGDVPHLLDGGTILPTGRA